MLRELAERRQPRVAPDGVADGAVAACSRQHGRGRAQTSGARAPAFGGFRLTSRPLGARWGERRGPGGVPLSARAAPLRTTASGGDAAQPSTVQAGRRQQLSQRSAYPQRSTTVAAGSPVMASDENKAPADTTGEKEQQDKPEKQESGAADSNKQAEQQQQQQQESAGQQQTAPAPAKPAPAVHKANFEKDIVYLYQFSRTPLIPSLSPYCLKVETWLRLAGIKYENVDHKMKFRSKKGQLPFVELNGEEIADSTIILKELGQRFGKDLDAGLTNDQKNVSHAMISMIENHLVWVVAWWRTKYPDNVIKGYKVNLQHALGSKIPNGILNFFFKFTFARKGAKKVKAQGMGVHKPEEIIEFGQNDLKVLSDMLADKPFFFGDEPTTLDVVAFSSLAQIYFIEKEVQYSLRDYMQENCANLVGHVNRMKERCFPDWEEICKTLDLNSHLPKPPPEEKESKGKEEEKKKEKDEKEGDKEGDKEIEKEIEKEKSEKEEKEVEKDVEENKQKEEKESK